ncbi:MAG: hypothetical protein WCC06_11920 [Candidatus Aminicenantales bacterium]
MVKEKRTVLTGLLLISLFFLGFSLFLNLPVHVRGFLFADQAVYYAMAQSIACDGDLEYTKKDLVRYYQDFPAGPNGIFLKKGKSNRIFYAKSFAYSLFAAPFVRIFGTNGFFVFHALLLFLLLVMGFFYFSLSNRPVFSLLHLLTFLFASVAGIYFLWISPDFFNLFLVFTIYFLWLYKHTARESEVWIGEEKPGRLRRFLLSEKTDYLAAFLAGIAVISKPPNVILLGPLVLWSLVRRKFSKTLLLVFFFVLSLGLLLVTNYLLTSDWDWNYQGGERKSFYFEFPFQKEDMTFDSIPGVRMSTEGYFGRFLLPFHFIFTNSFYYFFGRFTGIAWYFFPALLFLILFFLGKKSFERWLVFSALAAEILIYIVLMPDNYGGGGGSLANRYFLNIYPLFLFLPERKIKIKNIALSWGMASVFISQILITPLQSSAHPATHAKRNPFKLLPVEMTLINNIPTNTNPYGFRIPFGTPPYIGYMHFLDDNFYRRQEPEGTWTLGNRTAEMILKTYFPVREIVIHLTNNPRLSNEITVKIEGKVQKITLGLKQKGTLRFPVGNGFQVKEIHLYKIKVKAAKGSTPYFESGDSLERRYLGVFFELELLPRE